MGGASTLGINTLQEFVDAMKKNRGKGYATSGVGSNQHFLGEWFLKEAGVKLDARAVSRAPARR